MRTTVVWSVNEILSIFYFSPDFCGQKFRKKPEIKKDNNLFQTLKMWGGVFTLSVVVVIVSIFYDKIKIILPHAFLHQDGFSLYHYPPKTHFQHVIIGGGPAGIQTALLLKEAGHTAIVMERSSTVGSFYSEFPRKRRLISHNKRHVGINKTDEFQLRHDWHSLLSAPSLFTEDNFDFYPTASAFQDYLKKLASDLSIHLQFGTEVTGRWYDLKNKRHVVTTNKGDYYADYIHITTGYSHRAVPSCLEALSANGVSTYSYADFPDVVTGNEDWCSNKRIGIFGSGNSAFETADMLANCASGVFMFYKNRPNLSAITSYTGDLRISNAGILDRYRLKSLDTIADIDPKFNRNVGGSTISGSGRDGDDFCTLIESWQSSLPKMNTGGRTLTGKQRMELLEKQKEAERDKTISQLRKQPEFKGKVIKTAYNEKDGNKKGRKRAKPKPGYGEESGVKGDKLIVGGGSIHLDVVIFAGGFKTALKNIVNIDDDDDDKFPKMGDFWSDPKVPNVFYGGAIMHGRDYKKSAGGFVHGFRYNIRTQIQHILARDFAVKRPFEDNFGGSTDLFMKILDRIQNSSGLYQMQDYLVDLVVVEDYTNEFNNDGIVLRYYEEIPEEWIMSKENDFNCRTNSCMTIKFAYGQREMWDYELLWKTERYRQDPGLFLHPVISGYYKGEKVVEEHAKEDFEGEWTHPRHEKSIMQACSEVVNEISLFG